MSKVLHKIDLYHGWSEPIGMYASRLEWKWQQAFDAFGWDAKYIGHSCRWADFLIDGIHLEIKPRGEHFAVAALGRAWGRELVLVQDSPGFCTWWFAPSNSFAAYRLTQPSALDAERRINAYPRQVTGRTESLGEFIERCFEGSRQ